ncbi:MAG: outer-membrane immunogenic protein precursor [Methylocystis sp.]|nr:MAG: outer-membrane immunogenic protein precursor [Methylocystis sp.]
MKKIALSVAALALTAGSALAADLPSRKAPAYIPPPPPPPMWTGFYVGLNAGGTFGGSNTINTAAFGAFPFAPLGNVVPYTFASAGLATTSLSAGNNGGFIGGGQIGYNWQFYNSFVVGVEADIQGIAASSSAVNAWSAASPVAGETLISGTSASRSIDYIGTVRGRLGWLFTPTFLLYGTGGLAYGGVSMTTGITQQIQGAPAVVNPWFGAGAFSDTRTGWTAGGGVEWMFMPNWSAKVEYLYYDLGSVTFNTSALISVNNAGAPFTAAFPQTTTRFDGHIVRAGLNYHFNWGAPAPVVAKY